MATDPSTPRDAARNSQRRKEVMDAAAAAFARHGYHGASTRAIADELGIKVASLYFHIASKEEALGEICLTGMRYIFDELADAIARSSDLAGMVRLFFRNQYEDYQTHGDYLSVFVREARHLSPEVRAQLTEVNRAYLRTLDGALTEAKVRGEMLASVEPRQVRFVLIGTMRNLGQLYTEKRTTDLPGVVSGWVEILIRGMVANYAAPETSIFADLS